MGNPSTRRQAVAVGVAALAAALGGVIFGEYDLSGITPFVGGLLFGLVIGEVILTVARAGNRNLAVGSSLCTGGGMYWAAHISAGIGPISGRAYLGILLSMIVAPGWVVLGSGRRARRPPAA